MKLIYKCKEKGVDIALQLCIFFRFREGAEVIYIPVIKCISWFRIVSRATITYSSLFVIAKIPEMTTGSQIDSLTTDKSMELSEVQTAPPSQGRIELPHKPDSENLTGINHAGLKLDYDSYRHFLDREYCVQLKT